MDFFHGVQVAVMFGLMSNIVQFAWWTVKKKRAGRPHCSQFGPVYVLLVSSLLVLTQPVCMLVIGSWSDMDNFFFDYYLGSPPQCLTRADCGANKHPHLTGSCTSTTNFTCSSNSFSGDKTHIDDNCAMVNCTAAPAPARASLGCFCDVKVTALAPDTTIGWVIQIFGTYLGFLLMFIGVFWATQLHIKIYNKWKGLRGTTDAEEDEEDCED